MAGIDWRVFWNSYRKGEIQKKDDLLIEVGKTVEGRPISLQQYQWTIEHSGELLRLAPNDKLLELCCGNGLLTQHLAQQVAEVRAVDFSEHLIANAQRFHPADNITYICAEALAYLRALKATGDFVPDKILLGDALGYFEPEVLGDLLRELIRLNRGQFLFVATAVPCEELKWNFYDTPERQERYRQNQMQPGNTNDGIGRWWSRHELADLAKELNLEITCRDQPAALSNFRIDVVVTNEKYLAAG